MNDYYIGLISGTSADGIDGVIVDFSDSHHKAKIIAEQVFPISDKLNKQIHDLCLPQKNTLETDRIDHMGEMDQALGFIFSDCVKALLQQAQLDTKDIKAIGSHGQTIRHRPDSHYAFTLQIGDPNVIAWQTGITTVSDFRRMDMAAGGQGAPLVPIFHHHLLHHPEKDRVILNLGGIANITWLAKDNSPVLGYDTGPASTLLDYWCRQHLQKTFDDNGDWAKQGQMIETLLNDFLSDPYFKRTAPKSTGREYFDSTWLLKHINDQQYQAVDIQTTLTELTAITIAESINGLTHHPIDIFACGGGRLNIYLMQRIQAHLKNASIQSIDSLGFNGDMIEAMTFAWLAKRRLEKQPGNIPSVTGAQKAVIMGSISQAF